VAKVKKNVTVSGTCRKCTKKNKSTVEVIGEQGSTGDWLGNGKCGECGAQVALAKFNIKF